MQYFGGKQRVAARLAEVLRPAALRCGAYVEPFVGGASMMAAVDVPCRRIGADANAAIICMWEALASGWEPPAEVSEGLYNTVRALAVLGDPLTAFVGFGCSFAGKWFGGYARGGDARNYAANAASSLRRKAKGLRGVEWRHTDYRDLDYPPGCLIYCDPPYAGTTEYAGVKGAFDTAAFWDFCRVKSRDGHAVFVSEYKAPDDALLVLEVKSRLDIRTKDGGQPARTERLYAI